MLALLAMMLAPAAMHRAEAAPASHHEMAAPAGHCADGPGQQRDDGDRGRSADCAIACSAMPSTAGLAAPAELPRAPFGASLSPFFAGTAPGSDPPPPRLS